MPKTSPEESFQSRLAVNEKRAWLRPLGTGETIDTALRLYQRSAWMVLRLTAIPMVVCLAAVVFFQSVVVPGLTTTRNAGSVGGEVTEIMVAIAIGVFVAGPLFCLGLGRATGTVVSLTTDLIHGRKIEIDSARAAASKSTGAVAASLALALATSLIGITIAGLIALFGMLLERQDSSGSLWSGVSGLFAGLAAVVGFITFPLAMNSRSLAPVVAVVEGKSGRQAVQRSRRLMKSFRGHTMADGVTVSVALILLLFGIPLYFSLQGIVEATGLKGLLSHWSPVPGVGQLLAGVADGMPVYLTMWLLLPLWPTAMTVLYYDRIVRFEAYDVQVMLEDIKNADRRSVLLR